MLRFILKRISQSFLVLFITGIIAFSMFTFVGDPVDNMLGQERTMEDVERLRKVLLLKRVLSLNKNLEHTLQAFRPGVQILFPTREDMRNRYHLIDREVAQLFYETKYPYQVAQRQLNEAVHRVQEVLGE